MKHKRADLPLKTFSVQPGQDENMKKIKIEAFPTTASAAVYMIHSSSCRSLSKLVSRAVGSENLVDLCCYGQRAFTALEQCFLKNTAPWPRKSSNHLNHFKNKACITLRILNTLKMLSTCALNRRCPSISLVDPQRQTCSGTLVTVRALDLLLQSQSRTVTCTCHLYQHSCPGLSLVLGSRCY